MSINLRRQISARKVPEKQFQGTLDVSVEDNLGKLGFLSEQKKKSKKSSRSRTAGPSDNVHRTSSRASGKPGEGNPSRSSINKPVKGMSAVLDVEHSRNRRDKTFLGGECAVCDEQLELTLRGERILQLSCGHIAHEACFYEYLREFDAHSCPVCNAPLSLDSSRGGAVPNIDILSNAVRQGSAASINQGSQSQYAPNPNTQMPWGAERASIEASAMSQQLGRIPETDRPGSRTMGPPPSDRGHSVDLGRQLGHAQISHTRSGSLQSNNQYTPSTSYAPSAQYQPSLQQQQYSQQQYNQQHQQLQQQQYVPQQYQPEQQYTPLEYQDQPEPPAVRRPHDYDVQSMETAVNSPRPVIVNPIPSPVITLKSEFPTINRSRQQQSLTCLVTIEVPLPNFRNTPMEMGVLPARAPSGAASDHSGLRSPTPRIRSPVPQSVTPQIEEAPEELERTTEELHQRVENWHGLDFSRFGQLRLHCHIRVGKDRRAWQDLDCYLFSDMLICVKERKSANSPPQDGASSPEPRKPKCTLKGSILIKKHLKTVDMAPEENLLTLTLSVAELPAFYLQFRTRPQMEQWRRSLLEINNPQPTLQPRGPEEEVDSPDEEDYKTSQDQRLSSVRSSYGAAKSHNTAPTDYSNPRLGYGMRPGPTFHVPLDIVVVIPVSSSMQGLKISLLRDTLRFLVSNLGERDRMGLVTFGSSGGGVPLVGMTSKAWPGWQKTLENIRPVGQKSLRADVVEGANVAMDLLMQRKSNNPLASILLISDSSTSDNESVDFVVQRAEAAKVAIHSFGLGLTHKPDTMIEISTRTKASYTYVKDWMMLRECLAGVFGSLQFTSHQNVKLKLRLPEGSPAKFVKISGALHYTKRATGRDAEAALGDLRYGDKRDILVQLIIPSDISTQESVPHDPWETIVSGLEALGGSLETEEQRTQSVEEVPLVQADLVYGDLQRDGTVAQLPRPSLLTITMLPTTPRVKSQIITRPGSPPIPPHPSVVQRRMELLTSDMLTRALTLVSRGQHERAHHLLSETKSILKGLGKGGLPPIPAGATQLSSPAPPPVRPLPTSPASSTVHVSSPVSPDTLEQTESLEKLEGQRGTPSPPQSLPPMSPLPSAVASTAFPHHTASLIDSRTVSALEFELDSSLEWINHPAVFSRDSRKGVLQAIGIISSQRAYTFRTPIEALWAERIDGIKKLSDSSRDWREISNQQSLGEGTVVAEE